jgi:ABC-2 type transport system ATP-binding protein
MQEVEGFVIEWLLLIKAKLWPIKLDNLISENKEQVIEVEFDYKIEEQVISKIENLLLKKHAWYDLGVDFTTDKDMRPSLWFCNSKWFKNIATKSEKQKFRGCFREITK